MNQQSMQINKVRYYLENTNLVPIDIVFEEQFLRICCSDTPTNEQLRKVQDAMFFTDRLVHCSRKDGHLLELADNNICIDMTHYNEFCKIYQQLEDFGMHLISAEIAPNELTFSYTCSGRATLNYAELEVIQDIIDPSIEHHDSIRVMGMHSTYSLVVHFKNN